MAKVIRVENLSKAYQLGDFGTGTVSRDLERFWARMRGKDDPFLKVGAVNNRIVRGESDIVWSLKDLNFDIGQGDTVGIIGRNGAGKSTLLKILSRVTSPTMGSVKVKGRIASLLEVGTGFHPELTGKENIYLNGAILGMRKAEIKRKFDEIVDFAGVERYIHTPVKRYSSGMYVRLAFAVAAHLESEILIVDEVLAVGDAEFQKKCLSKMGDVSKGEGRTVLFVSHNMQAIQKLCRTCIFLKHGMLESIGRSADIVSKYLQQSKSIKPIIHFPEPENTGEVVGFATQLQVEDQTGQSIEEIPVGRPWQIRVLFTISRPARHFIIGLGVNTIEDINIKTSWSNHCDLQPGKYEAVFKEDLILTPGVYGITIGLSNYERVLQYLENITTLTISDITDASLDSSIIKTNNALILNPMNITITNTNNVK